MTTNKYEETYYCVRKGAEQVCYVNEIVEFLKAQTEPVSCATVGRAIFGAKYDIKLYKGSCASYTGQVLKHLGNSGFVRYIEVKQEPIEIETVEWIMASDENGQLPMIKVYDDDGNEYTIENPRYSHKRGRSHLGKVKKTIIPTIRKYFWVEN